MFRFRPITHLLASSVLLTATLSAQAIRGLVVDPEGQPVANARVQLVQPGTHAYRHQAGQPTVIASSTTSKRGRFALDASTMVPGISYTTWIVCERFADLAIGDLRSTETGELDLGTLQVSRGAIILGTVHDTSGATVEDATIRIHRSLLSQASAPARVDGWITTTDAEGRFRIASAPVGPVSITVVRHGFAAHESRTTTRSGHTNHRRCTLEAGHSILGVVLDPEHRPIPGARISARPNRSTQQAPPALLARTDQLGRYRLDGLDGNSTYSMTVRSRGFQILRKALRRGIRPALDFELKRVPQIQLRVRDKQGTILSRYAVQVVQPRSLFKIKPFAIPTIHDGIATIDEIPRGTYQLEIRAPGFAPLLTEAILVQGPGPVIEAVVGLGGSIQGQMVDQHGKPIAGARLELLAGTAAMINNPLAAAMLQKARGRAITATSNADGRFEFKLVRPGDYKLILHHEDFIDGAQPVGVGDGETKVIETISMHPGIAVHGTTLQAGKVVGGVKISLRNLASMAVHEAISDDKGGFRLLGRLAPGSYQVTAARHQSNPFQMLAEMAKNRSVIEIPADQARFQFDIEIRK